MLALKRDFSKEEEEEEAARGFEKSLKKKDDDDFFFFFWRDGRWVSGVGKPLHYGTFALLRPWVVLLVRGVDQGVRFFVLFYEFAHRRYAFGEGPSLH